MSKKPSPLYYEEIGDDFDGFMSEYDVTRRIELIESLLPADSGQRHCLEVGCGTGRISEALRPRVASLTVSDISEKLARGVGERLDARHAGADACALPMADATYDLVVSSECIEHTPDPLQAVREMARVLRPGGVVVLTTPNRLWYPALVVARFLRVRKYAGTENWVYPGDVGRTFEACGLRITARTGCHLFPWQIPGAQRLLPTFDRFGESLYRGMINFAFRAQRPLREDRAI